MYAPRLAAALLAALALSSGSALARPLIDSAPTAALVVPDMAAPLVQARAEVLNAPAPRTHTYTRRARAHP